MYVIEKVDGKVKVRRCLCFVITLTELQGCFIDRKRGLGKGKKAVDALEIIEVRLSSRLCLLHPGHVTLGCLL